MTRFSWNAIPILLAATALCTLGLLVFLQPGPGAGAGGAGAASQEHAPWNEQGIVLTSGGEAVLRIHNKTIEILATPVVGDTLVPVDECAEDCQAPAGPPGAPGPQGQTRIIGEVHPAGAECPSGGFLLRIGSDGSAHLDGILQDEEVGLEQGLCWGAAGPAGAQGPVGRSGEQGPPALGGPTGPAGPRGPGTVWRAEPPPDACTQGGVRVLRGLDDGQPAGNAGDGLLQESEVDAVTDLCNGRQLGALGDPGADALVAADAAVSCQGIRLRAGRDDGIPGGVAGNGELEWAETEVGPTELCHGADAAPATPPPGHDALLGRGWIAATAACRFGGWTLAQGLDDGPPGLGTAGDGVLHPDEVDRTWSMCHANATIDADFHWIHPYPQPPTVRVLDAASPRFDMALGAHGLPVVAVVGESGGGGLLWLDFCLDTDCRSTHRTVLATSAHDRPSITIGSDGLPVVAYLVPPNNGLRFVKCLDMFCDARTDTAALPGQGRGWYHDVAIGVDGNPVLVYHDHPVVAGPPRGYFMRCLSLDCTAKASPVMFADEDIEPMDVAIDHAGLPIIAYRTHDFPAPLVVGRCQTPTCASHTATQLLPSHRMDASVAVAPTGVVHVAAITGTSLVLFTCTGPGGSCASSSMITIDTSVDSVHPEVTTGLDGRPVISYAKGGRPMVAKCLDALPAAPGGPTCTRVVRTPLTQTPVTMRVDTNVVVGYDGSPRILYGGFQGDPLALHTAHNPFGVPGWWRRG